MVAMLLTKENQQRLVALAKESIEHGLATGELLPIHLNEFPAELTIPRATFVTLDKQGQLRGCIGRLEAARPLVADIVANAFAAAFHDSRFPALTAREFNQITIHLSILSPAQPIVFSSEQDLIKQLRPFIDGLILQEGYSRGTFLPSVWQSLPQAEQFLRQLKQKAGLPPDYWSDTIKVSRYETEMF